MKQNFLDESFDKKLLLKNESGSINHFLLENNTKQLEQICDFLKTKFPLLLLNGFMGTGKTRVVNYAASFTSPETIKLKYNCFETTILDDILLSFFDEFKKLTALGVIETPKAKSDNFTQKINSYFETINKPILIIINSFEELLKENKQEIVDFIIHLTGFENIKIILVSRNFSLADFDKKVGYKRVTTLALEKSIFEKYLRAEGFKNIGPFSDELYKHSRGYFFYTSLAIKIMQLRKLALIDFIEGFSKSFLSFNDFILREALSFVDPVSGHLFRFLTTIRHPISLKLLVTLHLYDEERFKFFIENLIITKENDTVYLQDYYKVIAENSIPENVAIKLHKGCVDLYNTQLPLKPLERDLLISRQTMRKEIEYHSMFIPKKVVLPQNNSQNIEYREYPGSEVSAEKQEDNKKTVTAEKTQIPQDDKNVKDEKLKNMSFIFDSEEDEMAVLNQIATSIKNFLSFSDQQKEAEEKASLTELINLARQEEQAYNYKRVISLYQRALTLNSDEDYYTFLPTVYTKLAAAYQNLSDWFNSLKYFELALEFFKSTGDYEKENEIKLAIANIYYITFKREQSKKLLIEILGCNETSSDVKVKTYMALANLSENLEINYDYYKRAMELIDKSTDKKTLSELYFKYALLSDDRNDPKKAVEFYKKCIDLDSNPKININLSAALSNMAELYDEAGNSDFAVKYYLESLRIDELTRNFNGIYLSSMKLAELYTVKDADKAVKFFEKAKVCAKELGENFYIASNAIAIGDFYYNRNENEKALENYLQAKDVAKDNFSRENIDKIDLRISDIKARTGDDNYTEMETKIKNGN